MANRYISDLHFFHKNVTAIGSNFDNRPFQDIEEMHEGIRKRWNQEVAPKDDVYVLGDLIWNLRNGNREAAKELLDSLNGKLHLILGNHDRTADPLFDECFEEVTPYKRLTELLDEQKRTVILSHYYMPFYEHHMHGAILLHGHSHRSQEADLERKITAELQAKGMALQIYNVGCMYPYIDYTPRTLQQIMDGYERWQKECVK